MKKTVLAATVLLAQTVGAFAQSANFEGLSAAININMASSSFDIVDPSLPYDPIAGKKSTNGSLQIGYGMAITSNVILTLGTVIGIGNSNLGDNTSILGYNKFTTKNHSALYIEPGWKYNDKTIIYGKIFRDRIKVHAAYDDLGGAVTRESHSLSGSGLGIGVRTMLNKSTFAQVELRKVGYDTTRFDYWWSVKPEATIATIGVGVKF